MIYASHIVSNVVPFQGKIRRWVTTSGYSAVLKHSFIVGFLLLIYAYINWADHNYYLYLTLIGLYKWVITR